MAQKDYLVPPNKAKHRIYLDQRGKNGTHPVWGWICIVSGILSILYCLGIYFFVGYGSKFFLVWGLLGVALEILGLIFLNQKLLERIPVFVKYVFVIGVVVGGILFLGVEAFILSRWNAKAGAGADYVIVLGAQWKTGGPSYVLQKRLDAVLDYLLDNPETKVIVSGGKGSNEPISEAEGMATYLENMGISEERIILEDRSTNTHENLLYSSEFLQKDKDSIVIITNNFHVFRALSLAKKQGYVLVEGLAAKSHPVLLLNNMVREFVGVMKDFLFGNI